MQPHFTLAVGGEGMEDRGEALQWDDVYSEEELLQMLESLPMEGKVTASADQVAGSGTYWCIELAEEWQQHAEKITHAVERIHRYDKSVRESWEALKGKCVRERILSKDGADSAVQQWVIPPGPHGLHITLAEQKKSLIGKSIHFTLSRCCSYQTNALGDRSPLEPSLLPCRWFVVRVEFTAWADGSALSLRACAHKPHISLALHSLRS